MKKVSEVFFSIQNADEEKRLVSGVSDSGEPNGNGLRLDYETSKPFLVAWSEGISKKTKGASKGILRVMHELRTVGKIVELSFDDSKRQILVTAHVSDDEVWQKIQGGEYTGFSWWWRTQGMPWKNDDASELYGKPIYDYTGKPIELSIVDAACVPGSDFTEIQNADFPEEEDTMADEITEQTADPVAPIAPPESEVAPVVVEVAPVEDAAPLVDPAVDVKNGMYTAGRFGEVLESLAWLIKAAEAEEVKEGESATIPEELRAGLRALAEPVAKYMVAQVKELAGGEDVDMLHVSDDDDFADLDDVKNSDGGFGSPKLAHRATVRAVVSGDAGHHERAASFHKEAAKVQGRAGKKTMEAYHKGMNKVHSDIKNCMSGIKNADQGESPDLVAIRARLEALESGSVKNADQGAIPPAPPAPALRSVSYEEDAGVEVKNAETQTAPDPIRAEAERIAALPPQEQTAEILKRALSRV